MWTCLNVKALEESLTSSELTSSNSVLGIFLNVLRSFSEAIWMFWSFVRNLPRGCRWLAHSHCFLLSLYACFLSSFQSSPALLVYYLHFTYFLSYCTCVLLCLIRQACCIIRRSHVYIYIYITWLYTCLDTRSRFMLWCHIWWYDLIRRIWYFLLQYILTLCCTGRGQGDEKPLAPTVLRGLNEECARRWPAQDVSGRLGPCTREATWSNGSVEECMITQYLLLLPSESTKRASKLSGPMLLLHSGKGTITIAGETTGKNSNCGSYKHYLAPSKILKCQFESVWFVQSANMYPNNPKHTVSKIFLVQRTSLHRSSTSKWTGVVAIYTCNYASSGSWCRWRRTDVFVPGRTLGESE